MAEQWEQIRDGLIAAVEGKAKAFLDANQNAKALIIERTSRLAKLTALYVVATPAAKVTLKEQMEVVQQTIENDLAALAVNASAEARDTVATIAGAIFDGVVKVLPGIVGIL